jgi:integrase
MVSKLVQIIKCPRGVTVRQFKHERRIQISFSFRRVECRELLPPGPITQSSITYATGLRAEVLRKISIGTFHYPDYFPASSRATQFDASARSIMVTALLQKQLDVYERQVSNGSMSPSTLDGYRKAIKSERMQYWDGKPLAGVTPSALRDWIASFDVTAKFARNLLTPMRSLFEDALNDELIQFNPFDRIALSKLLKQISKKSTYLVDPFTAEERAKLILNARADERPMVQFWFETGLRHGELIALKWSKIDWIKNTARIDLNQVVGLEKSPKTNAGIRNVDLSASAQVALVSQKPTSFLAGEHIWLNPRTGKAWSSDAQIRKTLWQPLCIRAGVRYRNPYMVRHTFASAQLTSGTNPWYVAQQLGHADVQMVFRIYGKFISQDFQKPKLELRAVEK